MRTPPDLVPWTLKERVVAGPIFVYVASLFAPTRTGTAGRAMRGASRFAQGDRWPPR